MRDFILPAHHATEVMLCGDKLPWYCFWQDSVKGLEDGGPSGYAYLARSVGIISAISPQNATSVTALQYLGNATSKMRESMLQSGSEADMWEVYALLAAEAAALNFKKAAAVHGLMMRRLLQPPGKTVQAEHRLLMMDLMHDMTRASRSLTRPAFRSPALGRGASSGEHH